MVWRRVCKPQANEGFGGDEVGAEVLRLALGHAIQVGQEEHLQNHHRVIGHFATLGPTLVAFYQLRCERLPIDRLVQLHQEMIRWYQLAVDEITKEASFHGLPKATGHGSFLRK